MAFLDSHADRGALMRRVDRLEIENEELRQKLDRARAALKVEEINFPSQWRIERQHADILRLLLSKDLVPYERMLIYILRGSTDRKNTVQVQVCRLRRKLRQFGVSITTNWRVGYYMTPRDKELLRQRIASDSAH